MLKVILIYKEICTERLNETIESIEKILISTIVSTIIQ